MPTADRIAQFNRGVRLTAIALVAIGTTEVLSAAPPTVSASSNEQSRSFKPSDSLFGVIGDRTLKLSSKVWECVTQLGLKIHAPKEDPTRDVTGIELTVFNSSNPGHKVRLMADKSYNYSAEGYIGLEPNGFNPESWERFALLQGNRVKGRDCKDCPQTEISAYESENGVQMGPVATFLADCPNDDVCVVNGYWSAGYRFPATPTRVAETPEPTKQPEPTFTPTPGSGYVQAPPTKPSVRLR